MNLVNINHKLCALEQKPNFNILELHENNSNSGKKNDRQKS